MFHRMIPDDVRKIENIIRSCHKGEARGIMAQQSESKGKFIAAALQQVRGFFKFFN